MPWWTANGHAVMVQQTEWSHRQRMPDILRASRSRPHHLAMHRLEAKAAPCAAQTRAVGSECFLEACVENGAKAPLVLDYVRFDPTPGLLAAPVVRSSSPAEVPDLEPLDVPSLQVVLPPCLLRVCHDALGLMGKGVRRFVACRGVMWLRCCL